MAVEHRRSFILIWSLCCKLLFLTQISGYSTGARTDSCANLDITHMDGNDRPILASTDPSPFRITVLNTDNLYRINREVTVIIEADRGSFFNGFILQARSQGSTIPLGKWTDMPVNSQGLDCQTSNDTLTHSSSQSIFFRLEMKWTPTQNYGLVEFWASITESFSVFWTNLRSQPIMYDDRPVIYFTESEVFVNEGDGLIQVEICVNRVVAPIDVSLLLTMETATEGDIVSFPRMLMLSIVSQFLCSSFSVTVEDDATPEPDETFLISISSVSGDAVVDNLNGAVRITIIDNDGGSDDIDINFLSGFISAGEDDGTVTVSVCASQTSVVEISISFEIVRLDSSRGPVSEDLTFSSSPVVIPADTNCGSLVIDIVNDNLVEDTEIFIISLVSSQPSVNLPDGSAILQLRDATGQGGGAGGGFGNININLTPSFQLASEDDGTVSFNVCTSQVIDIDIIIEFDITPVDSVNNPVSNDLIYTSPLTIPPGATCAQINIIIVNDDVVEADKVYILALTSSQPTVNLPQQKSILSLVEAETYLTSTVFTATDNILYINFTMNQVNITEDDASIQVEVCASRSVQQIITIDFLVERLSNSAVPVSDDLTYTSPLVIPAGSLCSSLIITVVQDDLVEDDESYVIILASPQPIGTLVNGSLLLTLTNSQLVACSSSPCGNGGTCVQSSDGGTSCLCTYGYLGAMCDEEEIFLSVSISPSSLTLKEGDENSNSTITVCYTDVQNSTIVILSVHLDTASADDVFTSFPLTIFTLQLNVSYPCAFLEILAIRDGLIEEDEILTVVILGVDNDILGLDEREITSLVTIEDEDPPCERLAPCRNGGQCQNENDGTFTCNCSSDWFGPTCEIENPCLVNNTCQNNGECTVTEVDTEVVQTCICTDIWTGQYCETAVVCSPDPCQNGGSCNPIQEGVDYKCINCPSTHIGKNCDIFLPCSSSPCQNGGTCTNIGQIDFECTCTSQFLGRDCSFANRCLENPEICTNGACVPNVDGTPLCECNVGFFGRFCDIPQVCAGNPCRNGGTCAAQPLSEVTPFLCNCATGFRGDSCEFNDLCSVNPCTNGGTCSDNGNSYTCGCPAGYGGALCENTQVVVNRCDLVNPCMNGGTCIRQDSTCQCAPGWEGFECEIRRVVQDPCPIDSADVCLNGARCVLESKQMRCICTSGFVGQLCDVIVQVPIPSNPCDISPCGPDGTCFPKSQTSYICTCDPDFITGEHCDVCRSNHCQNGGTCRNIGGSPGCECPDGVSGVNCEIVEACRNFACNNGGVCIVSGNEAICECQDGFIGKNCLNVDPCFGVNCLNGGACRSSSRGSCICPVKFVGDNCEIEVQQQRSSAGINQSRVALFLLCFLVCICLK